MAEQLAELNKGMDVDNYQYGTRVNILSYNSSSNKFTVPHTGYVVLRSDWAGNNATLVTSILPDFRISAVSGRQQTTIIPVFKGMQIYILDSPDYASYFPIEKR